MSLNQWASIDFNVFQMVLNMTVKTKRRHIRVCFYCPGSYVFCQQSRGALQFHGAWAGLQSEQEHAGRCGLQSDPGQEEGETDGGERRVSPGGGVVGQVGQLGRFFLRQVANQTRGSGLPGQTAGHRNHTFTGVTHRYDLQKDVFILFRYYMG